MKKVNKTKKQETKETEVSINKSEANVKKYSNIISDEDFNILLKYADMLEDVLKNNRIRSTSRLISKEIAYVADNHQVLNYSWGCGACMLNLYKRAAKMFTDNLKYRQTQNDRTENIDNAGGENS